MIFFEQIGCGVDGQWIAPNETDWPLCMYKDEYSCDPVNEITNTPEYLASGKSFIIKIIFITFLNDN